MNGKLQGRVATHLNCGGLFSNHFTLLSLLDKQFLQVVKVI